MRTVNSGELHGLYQDQETHLVASGAMKMPEEEMDWDSFFHTPAANVSNESAVEAAIEGRGDR